MDNTQHTLEDTEHDNGSCSHSWSCDICPYEDTYQCEMYINNLIKINENDIIH